jgi:DNA-binding response OmpR family regulator
MASTFPPPHHPMVAVFESDALVAEVVATILETEGYRVRCYSDGDEGRQAVLAEPFDLVILDWGLSGEVNGAAVFEQLRAHPRTEHLPVVVYTTDRASPDEDTLAERNGVARVVKPFDLDDLLGCVARLRQSSSGT